MSFASFASPSERAGSQPGSSIPPPMSRELARARRVRWLGVAVAAVVVLGVLWAFGVRPAGIDLLGVVATALLVVTALYGLEVAVAEWRSHRLRRLAAAEQQRRRNLAEALARSDAVDVAARTLVDATTPTEAADRLLAAARRLVPAKGGAVLLGTAHDLVVSMSGDAADDAPTVTPEAEELAGRVLARGATVRCSPGTADAAADSRPQIAVPLRAGAGVVGAMVLERGTGEVAFTSMEQRVLERLAPHGARALARTSEVAVDGVAVAPDRSSSRRGEIGGGSDEVDLAALLHGLADDQPGVGGQRSRRIVVLASAAAPIQTDAVALRTTLEELLRCVDAHAPDEAAIAVEVLPFDREVEIVVAHGGGVLPDRKLDEVSVPGDGLLSLRRAILHLGGTFSARERSGMAQVRVRLPVAGPGVLDLQQPDVPADTSARA